MKALCDSFGLGQPLSFSHRHGAPPLTTARVSKDILTVSQCI